MRIPPGISQSPSAPPEPTVVRWDGWESIPLSPSHGSFFGEPVLVADNGGHVAASDRKGVGKVVLIAEGEIRAETPTGETRNLQVGDPVYINDTLSTSARGLAKIRLLDGTIFQLGPSSRLSLDAYSFTPDQPGGTFESSIFLGLFRFISGQISDDNQGRHTVINTPTATIGIRGSELDIQVEQDGTTTIIHASGLIDIQSQYGLEGLSVWEPGTRVVIPALSGAMEVAVVSAEQRLNFAEQWRKIAEYREENHVNGDALHLESVVVDAEPIPLPTEAREASREASEPERPPERTLENEETAPREPVQDNSPAYESRPEPMRAENNPPPPMATAEAPPPLVPTESTQVAPPLTPTTPPVTDPLPNPGTSPVVTQPPPQIVDPVINFTLLEDGGQRFVVATTTGLRIESAPEHGELWVAGPNALMYAPTPGFRGEDTFRYRLSSGETITETLPVDWPLLTDQPIPGLTIVADPLHGVVDTTEDGLWYYWPEENFHGDDQFTYQLEGQTARVYTITVEAVNDPPALTSALPTLTVEQDGRVTLPLDALVERVRDPEESVDTLALHELLEVEHGQLVAEGAFQYVFVPETGYVGPASVTFSIRDQGGAVTELNWPVRVLANDDPNPPADENPVEDPNADPGDEPPPQEEDPNDENPPPEGKDPREDPPAEDEPPRLEDEDPPANEENPPREDPPTNGESDGDPPPSDPQNPGTNVIANDDELDIQAQAEEVTVIFPTQALLGNDQGTGLRVVALINQGDTEARLVADEVRIENPGNQPSIHTFQYVVEDEAGFRDDALARINVNLAESSSAGASPNQPPVAHPDIVPLDHPEDLVVLDTLAEKLLINDEDPEGEPLTIEKFADFTHLVVEMVDSAVAVRLEPDEDQGQFRYQIQDSAGNEAWGDVEVELRASSSENPPPRRTEASPTAVDHPLTESADWLSWEDGGAIPLDPAWSLQDSLAHAPVMG